MKTEKASIKGVERQIEAEVKRMAIHTTERRERARAKLEDAKKAIENAEARLKSLEPQLLEKRRRQRAFSAKGMAFKPPATRLRTGSRNVELKLESLGIAKRTQWPLFINQRSIESVVLTRTRAEGDEVCTRIGGNCSVGVVQIRA